MSKFLIKEVETCTKCEGTGYITHPVWERFFEEHQRDLPFEETLEYFRSHGYSAYDENDLPPDEIPCEACGGTGKIERWIDLESALEAILPCLRCIHRDCHQSSSVK